jgi:hypothetical protein
MLNVVPQITETTNPDSDVPLNQIYLIIGLVLLQMISVLQPAGERPAIPNPHHHSMLVVASLSFYNSRVVH